jgi:hypothetical protein
MVAAVSLALAFHLMAALYEMPAMRAASFVDTPD